MLLAVDVSSDQMGIYRWGTDGNKVFVEPVTDKGPSTVSCRPALEMPLLTVEFLLN